MSLPIRISTRPLFSLAIVALLMMCTLASAQRLTWRPHDFQPLTEVPWLDVEPHEVPKVVERIYREPNPDIRYAVLASYLKEVPLTHYSQAFDSALAFEGTNEPDYLVARMLEIWAFRNPVAALERTKKLFDVVGIEEGWLGYDSWFQRDAITTQNAEALRAGGYWLGRITLTSLITGAEAADLEADKKDMLLKEFSDEWIKRFRTKHRERWKLWSLPDLIPALSGSMPDGKDLAEELTCEIQMRRRLMKKPSEAPKIIEEIETMSWEADKQRNLPERPASASMEWLFLWAQLDSDGLRQWAEAQARSDENAWKAKCILIHQVDAKTQRRWLNEIPAESQADSLMLLAGWQPEMAMTEALRTKDPEVIGETFHGCGYGFRAYNAVHAGLGYLSGFDLSRLPDNCLDQVLGQDAIAIMEQWGEVDAGECARFGIRCLKHSPWVDWPAVRRFFSGNDEIPDEGGVTDRTFCALRVWALTKPAEMKAWIGTEPDAELRKSLTWLLEQPWGHHPKP